MSAVAYLLERPAHAFLSNYEALTYAPEHGRLKSEYTLPEQLSKLYLFVVMLVATLGYLVAERPATVKLSIAFLALGFVVYLAESNLIPSWANPPFGVAGMACVAFYLVRARSWAGLAALACGFGLISAGALQDQIHEKESVRSAAPDFAVDLIHIVPEERFDLLGVAAVCLAAVLSFRTALLRFFADEPRAGLFILLSSVALTFGNGLLHQPYQPGGALFAVALTMTNVGAGLLLWACSSIRRPLPHIPGVSGAPLTLCLLFLFVALPAVHGNVRNSTPLLLWLPGVAFAAVYLWRRHPVRRRAAGAA
ncbi:hypothetical protein CA12_09640 [Alienimonas californiensis]|uniref:Uncharacterized protein n=1 Tax=Alienimonas californiensis TaxID=2527989 RepID=A0A517P692_9PLAN|nr:hypothetical protein CA12_09640 [Alienimonas californiensis]